MLAALVVVVVAVVAVTTFHPALSKQRAQVARNTGDNDDEKRRERARARATSDGSNRTARVR